MSNSSCVTPKGTLFYSIGKAYIFRFGQAGVEHEWMSGWSWCGGGGVVDWRRGEEEGDGVSARDVVRLKNQSGPAPQPTPQIHKDTSLPPPTYTTTTPPTPPSHYSGNPTWPNRNLYASPML